MENQIVCNETQPPPIIGNFFEGWTSLYQKDTTSSARVNHEEEETENTDNLDITHQMQRRKSSIQMGAEIADLLKQENVKHAIEVLKEALIHLDKIQQQQENNAHFTEIYSRIIISLCDPNITKLVDELTPGKKDKKQDVYNSVLWRLFSKIVESGHTLQIEAHLAVVSALVDQNQIQLGLQAMYSLRRKEWDTQCYRTAVLLHLMQDPKQIMEAQKLLSDYGKPYLDIANPIAPNDLPPIRIKMPLMEEITEQDQYKLWMFYQAAQSEGNDYWNKEKEEYEAKRRENLSILKEKENDPIDWALEQLNIETEKLKVDMMSTENDNAMIYVAMVNQQFEYGWQVYKAMGDAVNESTPCIVMKLCWVAFNQIPIIDVSYRTDWESRAWSVYSRFMCSEYLHPEQPEAPSFIHDILCIAAHTPEVTTDKKARYTKTMSVYNLLVRLNFDKILCDQRVLEPLLCTLLYECKGSPKIIVNMCQEAFEIRKRKPEKSKSLLSSLWGLAILCLKAGDEINLHDVLLEILDDFKQDVEIPSSLLAPIQTFHDKYICEDTCYFNEYMFKPIAYTDDLDYVTIEEMNDFGILWIEEQKEDEQYNETWHTNIHEPQERIISMAVMLGPGKEESLLKRQMYYSVNKAKALLRHECNLIVDHQTKFPT